MIREYSQDLISYVQILSEFVVLKACSKVSQVFDFCIDFLRLASEELGRY
jgi:hypothetical protein